VDLKQEESRGEEARRLLDSALLKEAYNVIESNIVSKLALAATTDEQAKELRALLIALHKVRKYLENVLTTGTMAALEIERKRTLGERAADVYRSLAA
jgi:hypothetical protein